MTTKLMLSEFPFHWPSGILVKDIIDKITNSIDRHFPSPQKNFVLDVTWGNSPHQIKETLDQYESFGHIDNLFFVALFDPMVNGIPHPPYRDFKFFQIGNVNDERYFKYRIEFHAILLSSDIFKSYTEEDLELKFDNLSHYLCYQNKPHLHRQYLTHLLIKNELFSKGIVTLHNMDGTNKKEFIYPELKIFSIEETIEDHYLQDRGFTRTNNPYSLGETEIWQNCFLNVVCETFPNTADPTWNLISEKTFKPIIGMRPFIINGHRTILNHLEESGFYTFEEYWKEVDFRNCFEQTSTVDRCFNVIQKICNMPVNEIRSMYRDMLPKLKHNRQRFFNYAIEQKQKIEIMFDI